MRHLLWLVVLLLLAGCGPSTQSGVNKEYDVKITVRENSSATFIMGVEADSLADTMAGDAPATQEVKTPLSVALKGAQSGASTDEGGTTIEGNPINVEPIDASNRPVTNNTPATPVPVPVEQPDTGDSSGTDEPGDAGDTSGNVTDSVTGYKYKQAAVHKGKIHISGNYPERFVWPLDGPDYGSSLLIKCNDGQEMKVSNTREPYIIGKGNRKYVPGKPYFPGADAHQTMEYYADYSTKPNACTAYFNNKVSGAVPINNGSISGVDTVLYTFPCDGEMTYRDDTESEGIPQKVCVFTEFETCMDIPVDKFVMMWKDPTGNERLLEVPNQCSIAMDNKANGYGKFRPAHDKEPYKPVAYAPRGFNASEVNIIGKKMVASECSTGDQASDREGWDCMKTVQWEGNPNPDLENKEFSRCWWTDTTGDWHFLQRKFNFTKDKPNSPVLVVFDDGVEVGVSNVGKRHYPGAPGHVKWGVPKLDDGNTCKHYYSLAAPKDATPEAATLYYNE